ncbi:MAG: hypothetical protein KDA27_08755, partial [Candidatus Eisenbacteria bacterium]|nr:hypothetical protein [Candidatus Eisenbacteria bacterium]
MSGEGKKAKRRDKGARPSLLEPRKVLPIVLVAIVVVVLRTLAGGALQQERVLSTPVLEDRTYVTAIQQIQSTDFDEPVLPRGSVLYPRLVGWLPGMAEGSVKSLPLFQGILEGLAVLLIGVWVASRWGVLPALLG